MRERIVTGNQELKCKTLRVVGLISIVLLLIFNDARLIREIYEQESPPILFIVLVYGLSFFSIIVLLLNRNTFIRTVFQILLFSALYTDVLYITLSNFPFSFPDAINIFNNPGYAAGAWVTFMIAFLLAFAGAAIVYGAVYLLIRNLRHVYKWPWVFLFIGSQVFFYMYSLRYTEIYDYLPSVYRVSGNLITANLQRPEEQWKRVEVTAQPVEKIVQHIFLVVDESVTASALSINGFPLATTPFLQTNAIKFINFGKAASFTNFSAGSNLSLMSGMLDKELPDGGFVSFKKPSVFQFAKKAGYKTFLLDAQTAGNTLQNYTALQDLKYIDSLFRVADSYPSIPMYLRDFIIAERIALIAKLQEPTFVYVNKAGAHWPFNTNFPSNTSGDFFPAVNSHEYKNSTDYFKSLYWNVDRFWERLMNKLPNESNSLIVYTSDHGENYSTQSFKVKHASIYKANMVEGVVPLLVLDQASFFPENFSPVINRYSHQYIFPTILMAMGYNKDFIKTNYGSTLIEKPYQQKLSFLTGDLFGRGKNHRILVED